MLFNPSKKRLDSIFGFISGYFKSFELLFNKLNNEEDYWHNEALKNTSNR